MRAVAAARASSARRRAARSAARPSLAAARRPSSLVRSSEVAASTAWFLSRSSSSKAAPYSNGVVSDTGCEGSMKSTVKQAVGKAWVGHQLLALGFLEEQPLLHFHGICRLSLTGLQNVFE
jgi:hypothetical protein